MLKEIYLNQQTLSNEVTTQQIESILDFLIGKAIVAIMRSSNFMDLIVASALAWKTENPRRKISHIERNEVTALLFHYTCLSSIEKKQEVLKRLHLERSFLLFACSLYIESMEQYIKDSNALVKLKESHKNSSAVAFRKKQLEAAFKLTPEAYNKFYEVKTWYDQAIQFRTMIFSRYLKLVIKESIKHYKLSKQTLDYNDLIQNLIVAVYKAIDKFDSTKGTITSYIQQWIMDAKLQKSHEYGIAYYIPDSKKRAIAAGNSSINNIYVPLEDIEKTEPHKATIEEFEEASRIRRLAKRVDKLGLARYSLGIQESLTPRELQNLRNIYSKLADAKTNYTCKV